MKQVKIEPEDLIQRSNLSQHKIMIEAINDVDERQGNIENVTGININDISTLKTDVVALNDAKQDKLTFDVVPTQGSINPVMSRGVYDGLALKADKTEVNSGLALKADKTDVNSGLVLKLDKADINEDIHFGPITITKDGTAVIASLDAVNPTTGTVTPLSFVLPGATATDAGVMDASSVAWIADAENRISALEGLSDVKAIGGLNPIPTQAEINTAWMDAVGKAPETGDLVQDVSNAKLWMYITDTWIQYGTVVTVPLATTTSLGGVKDTALDAPANRWYSHVEADGRLSLIGGDSLSTLLDTTVPGIQSGLATKQDNLTFDGVPTTGSVNPVTSGGVYDGLALKADKTEVNSGLALKADKTDVNSGLALKQDKLTFDSVPTAGSANPVMSGGVKNALDAKQATITGGATTIISNNLTASRALVSNSSGKVGVSNVTPTELGHLWGSRANIQTQIDGKQDKLTFDSVPTHGSANPVTSGGVYDALDTKQGKLSFDVVPMQGSANPVMSGGVKSALDAKQDTINFTPYRVLVTNASGKVAETIITTTELGYLRGVTSNIQTQLDAKQGGWVTTWARDDNPLAYPDGLKSGIHNKSLFGGAISPYQRFRVLFYDVRTDIFSVVHCCSSGSNRVFSGPIISTNEYVLNHTAWFNAFHFENNGNDVYLQMKAVEVNQNFTWREDNTQAIWKIEKWVD